MKSDYTYTYDNRGNILTVSKSGVLFQQYVYDEASQVTAEYNYADKTAMTYNYDANGNIVSKTPYTNVTSSDLSTATQGTAIEYGDGDGNWSDKLISYNGQAISYDASGNQVLVFKRMKADETLKGGNFYCFWRKSAVFFTCFSCSKNFL